jgi:cyclopropane-fatty-acyl-phospholipid synthase
MTSALFSGEVRHTRLWPVEHRLRYPLYLFAIDLDELETLERALWLFGLNRVRPVSLYDRDYLTEGNEPIREKLLRLLAPEGLAGRVKRIVLVTSLRHFGRVFNPVSFHYVFDTADALLCVVAEVNNTFGERHVYVLRHAEGDSGGFPARFTAPKAFHVSPFNDMQGTYTFAFGDIENELKVRIDLKRGENLVFAAELEGRRIPLDNTTLLKTLLHHPLQAHLTMARIYREAAKLFFVRKLAYHPKPLPADPRTIGRLQPSAWQRLCRRFILARLGRIDRGSLQITLPGGRRIDCGDVASEPAADLTIHDNRFFTRTVRGGDIGLGESYTDGNWDSSDVARVFEVLILNRDRLADGNFVTAALSRLWDRVRHLLRANTVPGSRRNIHAHYDLGNDFYRTFLDASMTYSCARFLSSEETLEEAQLNKLRDMIAKAQIGPEDHVLEIGCGWGSFAVEAVRQTGCHVTGITVSRAQMEWARERVRQEGMEERIDIRLTDYRHIAGCFDRIVSIEMLEAVGHRRLGTFFGCCGCLLKPGGLMALQTITIPDERYDDYRRGMDWIRKHIFPGGHLPSPGAIRAAVADGTSLTIIGTEEIGPHYARTLREWRNRFLAQTPALEAMGLESAFRRKWVYYLASCEAGFATGATGNLQIVLRSAPEG